MDSKLNQYLVKSVSIPWYIYGIVFIIFILFGTKAHSKSLQNEYVYVTNRSTGLISICPVVDNGAAFSSCLNIDETLKNPIGITLHPTQAYAYITTSNGVTGSILFCPVLESGIKFAACQKSGYEHLLHGPFFIHLNAQGTYAYITNANSITGNSITVCQLREDGTSFTRCYDSGQSFSYAPMDIHTNKSFTYAYIVKSGFFGQGMGLAICAIQKDGTPSACHDSNQVFAGPTSVSLNAAETYLYVTNFDNDQGNSVAICKISQGGAAIEACHLNQQFQSPQGIVLNIKGTFAYVTNSKTKTGNFVSICPLTKDGSDFNICITSLGTNHQGIPTFHQPIGIALSP